VSLFWRASSDRSCGRPPSSAGRPASLFWRTARARRLVSCDTAAGSAVSALALASSVCRRGRLHMAKGSASSLAIGVQTSAGRCVG